MPRTMRLSGRVRGAMPRAAFRTGREPSGISATARTLRTEPWWRRESFLPSLLGRQTGQDCPDEEQHVRAAGARPASPFDAGTGRSARARGRNHRRTTRPRSGPGGPACVLRPAVRRSRSGRHRTSQEAAVRPCSLGDRSRAGPRKAPADLHDAADRFIAQGGKWRPTAELARSIDRAALGIAA